MNGEAGRKPKPYTRRGIGILDPWGDLWTKEVFSSEDEARRYLEAFWSSVGFEKHDKRLHEYRFVTVSSTTRVVKARKERANA